VEQVEGEYFAEIWKQHIPEGTRGDETVPGGPRESVSDTSTPPGRERSSGGEGKRDNTELQAVFSLREQSAKAHTTSYHGRIRM
jgi:hypothetical protein